MTWGYWEQDADGPAANGQGASGMQAVFRYTVPQEQSSYLVLMPRGKQTIPVYPAYHGEIAIDPANGDILRITVMGDLAPPYERAHIAIMVEYGPIPIGGTTYNCPVKGVALSKMPLAAANGEPQVAALPVQTQLNDVVFTEYHLFRADARIVPAGSETNQVALPSDK
jgi:hypothetical protein